MVKDVIRDAEERMKRSIETTRDALAGVRTGVANAALLQPILVPAYGSKMHINELATVSVPEPRTILITPWDKSVVADIEKAILTSDLGVTPASDGALIRLSIPPLTEERRKDLVKTVGKKVEEGKIAVRNVRRDANDTLKEFEKEKEISEDDCRRGQDDVQKVTDKATEELDKVRDAKETEIMQI